MRYPPYRPGAAPVRENQAVTFAQSAPSPGSHRRGRNAAHCPGRPLRPQGHPKILSTRSAERIFRTHPCRRSLWPQSFSVLEVRLLIVLTPGFGCGVCLAWRGGRVVAPGVPGCAPAPTAPGCASSPVAGADGAGQTGAGRAQSRCQQVRNASFQGQSALIFRTRSRAWRASRAGMCQIR